KAVPEAKARADAGIGSPASGKIFPNGLAALFRQLIAAAGASRTCQAVSPEGRAQGSIAHTVRPQPCSVFTPHSWASALTRIRPRPLSASGSRTRGPDGPQP